MKTAESFIFTRFLALQADLLGKLTSEEVYIWLYLQAQSRYNSFSCTYYFTDVILQRSINVIGEKGIKSAIKKLASMELIHQINKTTYYVDENDFSVEGQFYNITVGEFVTINDPNLLKHFIYIVKSFNYNISVMGEARKLSTMTVGYFAREENVATATISRYNKKLEELHIIYVGRYVVNNTRDNNIYSRYVDRDYVKVFMKNAGKESDETNFLRSVAQRYNNLDKVDNIEQLYIDCERYNEIMSQHNNPKRLDLTKLSV